jgi:hypothetical protein
LRTPRLGGRGDRLHAEVDAGDRGGDDLLDLGPRHPGGLDVAASGPGVAVDPHRDVVADGVLDGVAILQVGDAVVPVGRAAHVGAGDEAGALWTRRPAWNTQACSRAPSAGGRRLTRKTETARVPGGRPVPVGAARTESTSSRPPLFGMARRGMALVQRHGEGLGARAPLPAGRAVVLEVGLLESGAGCSRPSRP